MSGWVPMPADCWATVVEVLEASGVVWSEEAAAFDLRWHYDQQGGIPSRRALMARWRWPERKTRTLLQSTELWWDPKKGAPPTSQERPKSVPPVPQPRPTGQRDKPNNRRDMPQSRPTRAPPVPQECPNDVHTRVGDPPSPSPSRSDPPLPPVGGGPGSRVRWVRDRALQDLEQLADRGGAVEATLQLWRDGDAHTIAQITDLARPHRQGKRRQPAVLAGAPTGLRRRDVAEGLRLAAEAWPARGPPCDDAAAHHHHQETDHDPRH